MTHLVSTQGFLSRLPVAALLHALDEPAFLISTHPGEWLYNASLLEQYPQARLGWDQLKALILLEDLPQLQEEWQAGQASQQRFSVMFRCLDPSGDPSVHLQVTCTPLQVDGELLAWLGRIKPLHGLEDPDFLQRVFAGTPVHIAITDAETLGQLTPHDVPLLRDAAAQIRSLKDGEMVQQE